MATPSWELCSREPTFPIPPPANGFLHNGRILYAVQYYFQSESGVRSIVAWVDRQGNNASRAPTAARRFTPPAKPGQPIPAPRKLVTMKPGDELEIEGASRKIIKAVIFRE